MNCTKCCNKFEKHHPMVLSHRDRRSGKDWLWCARRKAELSCAEERPQKTETICVKHFQIDWRGGREMGQKLKEGEGSRPVSVRVKSSRISLFML